MTRKSDYTYRPFSSGYTYMVLVGFKGEYIGWLKLIYEDGLIYFVHAGDLATRYATRDKAAKALHNSGWGIGRRIEDAYI